MTNRIKLLLIFLTFLIFGQYVFIYITCTGSLTFSLYKTGNHGKQGGMAVTGVRFGSVTGEERNSTSNGPSFPARLKMAKKRVQKVRNYSLTFDEFDSNTEDYIRYAMNFKSGELAIRQNQNKTGPKILAYRFSAGFLRTFSQHVDLRKCEYNDCSFEYVTREKPAPQLVNMSLNADAVLFQGNWLPSIAPVHRNNDQVFIFFNMECPVYLHKDNYRNDNWRSTFNWTITYRRDSDIANPYALPVRVTEPPPAKNYSKIFQQKKKSVLWFVSHCKTSSKREHYVKEMAKYIDIDTFGGCSEYIPYCRVAKREKCLPEFVKNYKFYLSFENSLCEDYITEKYYTFLTLDIVPVVRGGADYSQIVPRNTYINTADFESPKALAQYLNYVGSSEESYVSYLKAKQMYSGVKKSYQNTFCSLCERLHHLEHYRKTYEDIGLWWKRNNTCHHPYDLPET